MYSRFLDSWETLKMGNKTIKDSGSRREFETGARRDMNSGKGRMDLLPAEAILRLTRWYELGAGKYGDHNWERGLPLSCYIDSALRHIFKFIAGCDDEDHLSAAVWNLLAIMFHQHHEQDDLNDLINWKNKKTTWNYELDLGGESAEN
jgi:hypothetical protein